MTTSIQCMFYVSVVLNARRSKWWHMLVDATMTPIYVYIYITYAKTINHMSIATTQNTSIKNIRKIILF